MRGLLVGIAACFGAWVALSPAAAPPPRHAVPTSLLIERLGDEEFARREEAARLLAPRDDAYEALFAAADGPDAEVRRRARRLAEQILPRRQAGEARRIAAWLEAGEWDLAVEALARGAAGGDERGLPEACSYAGAIAARVWGREKSAFPFCTLTEFGRYTTDDPPHMLSSPEPVYVSGERNIKPRIVVRAPRVVFGAYANYHLILSTGGFEVKVERPYPGNGCGTCLVFALGPVHVGDIHNSIVLSDSTVTADHISGSLVVARGDIRCSKFAYGSALLSGGEVTQDERPPCFLHKTALAQVIRQGCDLAEWGVRPFEPARVGLEVEGVKHGVRVRSCAYASAFGCADVRRGDVLTHLAGGRVEGPEDFRRALRTLYAERAAFDVSMLRDGERVTARVSFEE